MDIKQHIASLRSRNEILEMDAEIDGHLELAALTNLASKNAGPGLLFPRIKGTRLCLATNLFGSDRRMAHALGHECLNSFGRQLSSALAADAEGSSAQRLRRLLQTVATETLASERKQQSPVLDLLPKLRFWPKEGRSFLTLAVVISRDPESSVQNYGLYRVGIADRNRLTLNLLPGSGAGQHFGQWRAKGSAMPVAILLGADPALIFAAAAPLPPDCAEDRFSAYLTQSIYQSCRCQTVPLHCPTSGQILIEGWINPDATLNEGPFGCYNGNYGGSNDCPLVDVSALSMADEPLLPLTLAGPLPMEDCWIAKANLELIRARLTIDAPEIRSIDMPLLSAFYGVYFVRSSNASATAENLAQSLLSLDYLARIKMLILLRDQDDNVNDSNWRELLEKLPSEQLWQAPDAALESLMQNHPFELHHDSKMIGKLLQRLNIDAAAFTAIKG